LVVLLRRKSFHERRLMMADTGKGGGSSPLPENPLTGSSYVGPAVSGTAYGQVGVSGSSVAPPPPISPGGATPVTTNPLLSDGVLGEGKNGVHGITAYDNGVLGENSATGYGVSGTSARGTGVHGVNGAGSGTTPKFGCGVFGESDNGYGVYGASKNASGVYGASGPDHLAGEFAGDVSVTGKLTASGGITTTSGDITASGHITASGITTSGSITTTSGDITASGHITAGGITTSGSITTTSGDITASGHITATGNMTASDMILSGADCAEEFDAVQPDEVEAGMVVVFDENGRLSPAITPYDKRVAGVISGAGSFKPGVILDRRISDRPRVPVALVGKVHCRVDASYARIEAGDLLTTSATPGCAMKARDPAKAFGSIIGKALAPMHRGCGLIPILVTLG
jgi:hypothetical protein